MGFGSRIRMGLSKILAGPDYGASSGSRLAPHNSLNVNQLQYMASGGGFSQPVFGGELTTVGAYSREGYTSRTLDIPIIPFSEQMYYMRRDEDVQLAVNHLSSRITGGEHYWKAEFEPITEMLGGFSSDIDFDWIDTIMVKELLAFGNSVWKPRLGISQIRNRDDLMHIPLTSFVRVWWDRQRRPYKYEFRGAEYQGYHNPEDIIHMVWNPVNASAFGMGFLVALTAPRDFTQVNPSGEVSKRLPSLMDRKYSTAMTMHLTERRYISRNLYVAAEASQEERDALAAQLAELETGEDFVVGSKVEPHELGTATRNFDSTQFADLTAGQIFKALNDFTGKQGAESSHQYANAKTSAMLTEIGLTSFPLAVTRQLIEKLFQPWYESQGGAYAPEYGGGMIGVPWKDAKAELNFGRAEKTNLEPQDMAKLLEMGLTSGAIQDPIEIRDLLEDAGLGLRKEYTEAMNMQYNDPMAMPQDMQQQTSFDTMGADQQSRPMDDPNYNSMAVNLQGQTEPIKSMDATLGDKYPQNPQPSDPRINFTQSTGSASKSAIKKGFDSLSIDDINAWLQDSGNQETLKEAIKTENETKILAIQGARQKIEMRKKMMETIDSLRKKET